MSENNAFYCEFCGKNHEAWPAIAFTSPSYYHNLTEQEQDSFGKLSDDFCTITYPDQNDRFIRVVLDQKVIGMEEPLQYGLWVSLSQESFEDYTENFKNPTHEVEYFGWLCSEIPEYEGTVSIPTTVFTRPGNQRPVIKPHQDFVHPFIKDYYEGISKEEFLLRIHKFL